MIVLGTILMIAGYFLFPPIIGVGAVVFVIGLVLFALGNSGRAVGGRKHYY
jgi:hypothetical protein